MKKIHHANLTLNKRGNKGGNKGEGKTEEGKREMEELGDRYKEGK